MLRHVPFGVSFALVLAAIVACGDRDHDEDNNNFREDVIQCEEALARLDACCPSFDASRVLCNYYYSFDDGCGTATTRSVAPAFNEAESHCILETSCDVLIDKRVCARAQEAKPYASKTTTDTDTTDGVDPVMKTSEEHQPVCP